MAASVTFAFSRCLVPARPYAHSFSFDGHRAWPAVRQNFISATLPCGSWSLKPSDRRLDSFFNGRRKVPLDVRHEGISSRSFTDGPRYVEVVVYRLWDR